MSPPARKPRAKQAKVSPTKTIESVQRPNVEHMWLKTRGRLDRIDKHSKQHTVVEDIGQKKAILRELGLRNYATLHTHIINPEMNLDRNLSVRAMGFKNMDRTFTPNLPSSSDFRDLLQNFGERTSIIAQTHPETGEAAGFYFLRKTKKSPRIPIMSRGSKSSMIRSIGYETHPQVRKVTSATQEYNNRLERYWEMGDAERFKVFGDTLDSLKLQFKAKPRKGYKHVPGLGFVKK